MPVLIASSAVEACHHSRWKIRPLAERGVWKAWLCGGGREEEGGAIRASVSPTLTARQKDQSSLDSWFEAFMLTQKADPTLKKQEPFARSGVTGWLNMLHRSSQGSLLGILN